MEYDQIVPGAYYRVRTDAMFDADGLEHPQRGAMIRVIEKIGMSKAGYDLFVKIIATGDAIKYSARLYRQFPDEWLKDYLPESLGLEDELTPGFYCEMYSGNLVDTPVTRVINDPTYEMIEMAFSLPLDEPALPEFATHAAEEMFSIAEQWIVFYAMTRICKRVMEQNIVEHALPMEQK